MNEHLPAAVPAGTKAEAEAKRANKARIWRIMVSVTVVQGKKVVNVVL